MPNPEPRAGPASRRRLGLVSPAVAFVVLATTLGGALLAVQPPFRWGDENTHFLQAVRVSEDDLSPACASDGATAAVPVGIAQVILRFAFPPPGEENPSWAGLAAARQIELQPERRYPVQIKRSPYSVLPYAAQGLGIAAARLATRSALLVLYAARAANLLSWVLLVWLALRVAPGARWPLLVLALSPMATSVATQCSVDATTNGIALLWTAYVLHLAAAPERRIGPSTLVVLALLAAFLALAKSLYATLIPLLWIVPARRMGGVARSAALVLLLLAVAGAAAGVWFLFAGSSCLHGLSTERSISVTSQLQALLADPRAALRILANTAGNQRNLLSQLADIKGSQPALYPSSSELFRTALALAWLADPALDVGVSLWQRGVALAVAVGTFVAIVLVAYLYWTEAGSPTANGVQVRYLIPIIPPLLIALAPPRIAAPPAALRAGVGAIAAALCGVVLVQTVLRGVALFGAP